MRCHSTGLRGSRLRLYPEEFLRLPIIQPPVEEQRKIVEAIENYEFQGIEYDIVLLTHGVDNMLKAGPKLGWITWKNLKELPGRIHHGRLVYLQACLGGTLAPDWKAAGFKNVISYNDIVFNFFYADIFARRISKHPDMGSRERFDDIAKHFPWEVQKSIFYTQVISRVLKEPVKEYIANVPMPQFN